MDTIARALGVKIAHARHARKVAEQAGDSKAALEALRLSIRLVDLLTELSDMIEDPETALDWRSECYTAEHRRMKILEPQPI